MRVAPLILCLAVAGLSRADDPATRPATSSAPSSVAQPINPAAQQTAYVGVMTSFATPALREQLGLPGGVGVVIEAVDADSPAQRAGLQVHDIVTKLDDQLVINVHQFGVLIHLHRPGDTVNLSVIRHGKPATVQVQLADRAVTAADDLAAFTIGPPHGSGRISSIVTQTDGKHVITLTTHGDADHHVRIADTRGQVLYEGPLNTPDDRAHVPGECRAKVETIEKNWERFKQLRNGAPGPKVVPSPVEYNERGDQNHPTFSASR